MNPGIGATEAASLKRHVYMLLSPRALGYARLALSSLFKNSLDPFRLCVITDSPADRSLLEEEISKQIELNDHECSILSENNLDQAEEERFGRYPRLRAFRKGHPCWRKITDPLLLAAPNEEIVVLDPDLYFPNQFRFEKTPATGILLMWQRPNCLLPSSTVKGLLNAGIPLAHHVDIGVAHWRGQADLDWLEWLIAQMGEELPLMMHIEAIVWAALAMRYGGGHLDPVYWHCWRYNQSRRVLRRLGRDGTSILAQENFTRMKCFHAGGEAKAWMADAHAAGVLNSNETLTEPGKVIPFAPVNALRYDAELTCRRLLKSVGYYSVLKPS